MDWLLESLAKEWAVIKQTPISFILACGLCFLIAFFALRWVYQERLSAKEDMLSYYREKLGLRPADKTRYSGMRNPELRAEAERLVAKLRELSKTGRGYDVENMLAERQKIMAAPTEEEREALYRKQGEDMIRRATQALTQAVSTYNQEYKAEVVLLRDEILARLPPESRDKFRPRGPFQDEVVVNHFAIEEAADRLERIAKSLPSG